MDHLRLSAAAFFRGRGKTVVTENEFVMGISLDLRWMSPDDAKELLRLLVSEGHLKNDGKYLRPAFDVHATDVPLGFRPSPECLKNKKNRPPAEDIMAELMAKAESTGLEKKDFIVSANAVQKRANVDIEVAALIILREKGVDISIYADRVYRLISER